MFALRGRRHLAGGPPAADARPPDGPRYDDNDDNIMDVQTYPKRFLPELNKTQ